MSIGTFDANGDRIQRTTNLPVMTSWAACGWGIRRVDAGTVASKSPVCRIRQNQIESDLAINDNGANWDLEVNGSGTTVVKASVPADTWFFWAISQDGTGSNAVTGYYREVGDTSWTSAQVNGNSIATTELTVGGSGQNNGYSGMDLSHVKIWDAPRTANEFLAEMYSREPVQWSDLNTYYPLEDGSDASDFSGNGYDGTLFGSMVFQDEPPIPGRRFPDSEILVSAPAGGESGAFSAGISAGATFSALAGAAGSISAGLSADETHSAVAAAVATIQESLSADETQSALAGAVASIQEGLTADEAEQAQAATLAAIVEGLSESSILQALGQAAAAIVDGVNAGEAWASEAAAAGDIAAGLSASATFTGATQGAFVGAFSAGTSNSESFTAAVVAVAQMTGAKSFSEAFGTVAQAFASVSAGISLGASFEPGDTVGFLTGAFRVVAALSGQFGIKPALAGEPNVLAALEGSGAGGAALSGTAEVDPALSGNPNTND